MIIEQCLSFPYRGDGEGYDTITDISIRVRIDGSLYPLEELLKHTKESESAVVTTKNNLLWRAYPDAITNLSASLGQIKHGFDEVRRCAVVAQDILGYLFDNWGVVLQNRTVLCGASQGYDGYKQGFRVKPKIPEREKGKVTLTFDRHSGLYMSDIGREVSVASVSAGLGGTRVNLENSESGKKLDLYVTHDSTNLLDI